MHLIFHGDDFGLTQGVNQGIVQAYSKGLLRAASLIASGEAFDHAVQSASDHKGLDLGVHLTLTDEKPLLPGPGYFSGECMPSRHDLTMALATQRFDLGHAKRELCAQVEKILDAGVKPSHMDSHQFVHLLPGVFPLCLDIQKKYKIPFMRTLVKEQMRKGTGLKRRLQWTMLNSWSMLYVKPRIPKNLPVIPCTGFLNAGGRMTVEAVLSSLKCFSAFKSLEIMLHPGIGDEYTAKKYAHWGYSWKNDADLCTDPALKQSLDQMGVSVASFREAA
ncbi:carbohydrate deacetylase [Desulfatibacillum aliphaticivorans]|uniref:carbohydrate deacetylase n=1 Tax=Desulfatibacillum aliphaticivorans TaxID=218208 RepID=UPI0004218C9D|nr:ChbG/HpnK family deacetylase [Desulfatibacillum aliphaticivorans]